VAFTNLTAAPVNLELGIAFVKSLGLPGVAIARSCRLAASTVVLSGRLPARWNSPLARAGRRRVARDLARGRHGGVCPRHARFDRTDLTRSRGRDRAACRHAIVFVFFGISAKHRHLYWRRPPNSCTGDGRSCAAGGT
jgi:hypothetical protein